MTWILETIGMWFLAKMIFHVNPLNDRTNPQSKLHYYHVENIRGRRVLDREFEEDKANGLDDNAILLEWPDVWPYLCPGIVSIISIAVSHVIRAITG